MMSAASAMGTTRALTTARTVSTMSRVSALSTQYREGRGRVQYE